MWTANGWFGFNRLNLDEARTAENTKEPEENVTEEAIDEAATVDHARYMRSHGKKARDTGHPGTWMFTNKEYGDVNQNNNKEFHSARGSFADAKKSAQNWAKEHGHNRVYVMEDVEHIEEAKAPKIACVKCDEVATQKAWEKNHGTCPHCKTSTQGVAESTNLDEVSKRTLGSYATKALNRADIAARMSHSDSDEMGKIAAKRTAGVKKAVDKLATKKADATRIKTNVDKAREAARNRYTDKDDQGKAYYAAQKGISKIRESVELDEAIYHTVDWDGPSKVKVVRHDANEIDVRRVDKNNKEMMGDEHTTTYTKRDPEFREIKSKMQAADDHDAWKEKRAAALQGRRYHESVELDEKLTDAAKTLVRTALGPKVSGNPLRKTSQSAKAIIKLAKTNPDNMVRKEEVDLDEGMGGIYKDADDWANEAKSRGLTVKPATHPSGETTKYQIAKDKYGNNRGHFDHGIKSGRLKEEVDLEESMLASLIEGTVYHGPYELTSGKAMKGMGEGEPTHVHAHQRKMNKLGVPQHDKDDYGNTVLVHVKDTRTGDKTVHHVYQRGFTEPDNKEGKKVVSVRTVGQARPKSAKHNDVIKNYLSGKHFKNLQEQWIEDAILTTMVEEALAAKRSLNETRIEKDLQDHEPRVVHGYKGMKQRPFSKKFKNQEHMEKWMDSESSADHDIHTIEKA